MGKKLFFFCNIYADVYGISILLRKEDLRISSNCICMYVSEHMKMEKVTFATYI